MSKTLEELGFKKILEFEDFIKYEKEDGKICFSIRFIKDKKTLEITGKENGKHYFLQLDSEISESDIEEIEYDINCIKKIIEYRR